MNCGCVVVTHLKEPPLFRSHLLQFQFTSTPLYNMIQVGTFTAPRVNREHFVEAIGTGACIRIVGLLLKVYAMDYNQEGLVEMYDGTVVKVVDGPVSQVLSHC